MRFPILGTLLLFIQIASKTLYLSPDDEITHLDSLIHFHPFQEAGAKIDSLYQ